MRLIERYLQGCFSRPGTACSFLSCLMLVAGVTSTRAQLPEARSGDIPILILQTDRQPVVDRTRVPARMQLLSWSHPPSSAAMRNVYNGQAEISVRGNSSYFFDKKSYRLELQTETGRDLKAPLLGMPADSDWVLYASVTDRTFVRNILGHELWRRMGRYATRWRFIELFVITNGLPDQAAALATVVDALPRVLQALSVPNGSSAALAFAKSGDRGASVLAESYVGLYILMEKIKRGKERLDIAKLLPTDDQEPRISGGYLIKKDHQAINERGLLTGQELRIRYEDPKETELIPAQKQWLAKYLGDFEKALFGRNFRDSASGYARYIDVASFVDFHWLVELSKNADGFWLSQYMHKEREEPLRMGPVWDWDNAFGNPFFKDSQQTNGWRFETADDPDYTWFRRLFEDPDFLQRYVDRWSELRTDILAASNMLAIVEDVVRPIAAAQGRNSLRWERAGRHQSLRAQAGVTLDDEVGLLKDWILNRLSWIDSQAFPGPVPTLQKGGGADSFQLVLTWATGRLFYTTDGSDPRARGGSPTATAKEYTGPLSLSPGLKLTARVRSSFGLWSAPLRMSLDSLPAQ